MISEAILQNLSLTIYIIVSFTFCIASLIFAQIVAPLRPNPRKTMTYECGQVPSEPTRGQFTIQYYPYAMVYAIYGALAIILLLAAPFISTMPIDQLWIVLILIGAFSSALMGAVLTIKPLVKRGR